MTITTQQRLIADGCPVTQLSKVNSTKVLTSPPPPSPVITEIVPSSLLFQEASSGRRPALALTLEGSRCTELRPRFMHRIKRAKTRGSRSHDLGSLAMFDFLVQFTTTSLHTKRCWRGRGEVPTKFCHGLCHVRVDFMRRKNEDAKFPLP